MLKRYLACICCAVCTIVVLSSCGDSRAPGTADLATVMAVVTPPGGLDSDVAKWVTDTGGAATACGANSFISITPDDLTFTITSTAYTSGNTGSTSPITPSDLVVQSITLTYTPATSLSPALPAIYQTQYPSAGQLVTVGANPVTVRVASHEMKNYFMTGLGTQSITCSNAAIYSYWVSASFRVLEVNSGRVATITTPGPLLMRVADFQDK